MDIDVCIHERRTVKKFSPRSVSFESISEILDAGHMAPSSGNVQNWQFVVITDKKTRKELVYICDDQKVIEEAPVVIGVFSKIKKIKTLFGERSEFYGLQNCGACIQNMLLKAHSLSLGTAWIGKFDTEKVYDLLDVKDADPVAFVCIGYAESINQSEREPLMYLTYFEKWGEKKRNIGLWPVSRHASRTKNRLKGFIERTIKR